jgi:hypothetical protein
MIVAGACIADMQTRVQIRWAGDGRVGWEGCPG